MPVTNNNNINIPAHAVLAENAEGMFLGYETSLMHLYYILNLEDLYYGSMVILTSANREDKDRAMDLIVKDLCERNSHKVVTITVVGDLDFNLPGNALARRIDRLIEADLKVPEKHFGQVVLIPEVRTYEDAKVATLLAMSGHKVIFTHAAKSCEAVIADLSNMLCTLCHTETVMMDTVLEELCARDQVRAVQVG
ncbi:hypothetical protein YA0089_26335 [Pseudomonas viridiflava]|uniref:hypothetical protein n=1 Tax=Pseudomonas viridiflava TaxID=33069 RepID=UPI0018E5C286|nr:hypothetical protein [Pseudomonas viridiflava]MBI6727135.1 hypothetical protein [Pseudomonas viridiflava]